jgi:hypothetical protein
MCGRMSSNSSGEALELFSVERQLISSLHGESNLQLGVCSFALLSNICVH